MSRIKNRFEELKREKKKALILFVTAGDPDLKTTEELVPELFKAGADIVELGIPFSDPLADGPTIQESFVRALKKGVTLKKIVAMVKRLRKVTDGPLVLMSAYNLIYSYGLKSFPVDAGRAGVDGIILPDLIPDEAGVITGGLIKNGIDPIFLAAPTSGAKRIKKITSSSRGFVYYISVAGITGKQKPAVSEIKSHVAMIKKATKLPVACGFGITTPKQAADIGKVTDGVIIGSALVKLLAQPGSRTERIKRIRRFVRSLRRAL